MTPRRAAWLAWTACGLSLLMIAASVILPAVDSGTANGGPSFWVALGFPVVGALIASRRPGNAVGWIFCVIGLTQAGDQLAGAIGHLTRAVVPLADEARWVGVWLWIPGLGLIMTFMLLLFPNGRLLSRRWRIAAFAAGAGILSAMLSVASLSWGLRHGHALDSAPLPHDPRTFVFSAGALLTAACMLASIVSVALRFRRARGDERQQLKWFLFATALMVVEITKSDFLNINFGDLVLQPLIILGVPASVAIAIFKYRLYGIDLVVNRALVLGVLAVFITSVYVAIVVGIGSLAGTGGRPNLGLSIAATAVVAIAFQPFRERVQRLANRLIYGQRFTPYEVLARFSDQVTGAYSAEQILPRTAEVLAAGTGAARATVWVMSGTEMVPGATAPPGAAPVVREGADNWVPVDYQGRRLGELAVQKPAGEPLSAVERSLLTDLAAQAGPVLHNVLLDSELETRLDEMSRQALELRASRQRIVAAQDAERRKLERNIHDGAQQHLVALAVKLRLAATLAARNPERARPMLAELRGETTQALETLRDLARGIYPPLLRERGLVAALGHHATVDAEGLGRYDPELEAAVYFCCLEALQNAAKYAQAGRVLIRLRERNGTLSFTVEDDGRGFDPAAAGGGMGMRNMADRIATAGGELVVESRPGSGTTVRGRLPVRALQAAG
ncbi:MAG: ATP-binding protein [Candidatus Dormibacteria bacterium]